MQINFNNFFNLKKKNIFKQRKLYHFVKNVNSTEKNWREKSGFFSMVTELDGL